jgi:hypothetical protein
MVPLLDFLAAQQVLPVACPARLNSPVEILLKSFGEYLLRERGLASSTRTAYVNKAGQFLTSCAADGALGNLTAGDITVLCPRIGRSPNSA